MGKMYLKPVIKEINGITLTSTGSSEGIIYKIEFAYDTNSRISVEMNEKVIQHLYGGLVYLLKKQTNDNQAILW